MYLRTIGDDEATGRVKEIFDAQRAQLGFVMAATRCWTARPDLLPLYTAFSEAIRANFSLGMRAWRLITLVAAKQVPSTYCSHVYAKQLVAELGSKEAVLAIRRDFRRAGLDARDVEMLAYAEKVARNASEVGEDDIARLRAAGFSDVEIGDIALCASFRAFVSRYFDAVGAGAEPTFVDPDPTFRDAMTVGKAA
jgi:uncharacterized peroxidase-related enzyme